MVWQRCLFVFVILCVGPLDHARAQIYRWDNGAVIPGTEGITPRPGIDLSGWNTDPHNLRYGDFSGDLNGSNFSSSWLDNARFINANLTGARFSQTTLMGANLTGADVHGIDFSDTTSRGFTHDQLYSTASYAANDLRGIWLSGNNLTSWDFSGQNLTLARLGVATLTNANFTGADLSRANFERSILTNANLAGADLSSARLWRSTWTDANLTGANVVGTDFFDTTSRGFTKDQLYSTASYAAKDLQGIALNANDLTGWDFSGVNLTSATLDGSTLTGANLSGANLHGTSFSNRTSRGITEDQLYSTASYAAKDLQGIGLWGNNLTGWDFSGQNLTGARLFESNLAGADLTGANVHETDFGISEGFTKGQLYSTASYAARDLRGIGLRENNLTGWDFSGQNLTSADLRDSTLSNANFTGANVHGTNLENTTSHRFTKGQLYSTASYAARDLQGIGLGNNNLTGWDFSGQNLTSADLRGSTLSNANFTGANVHGTNLENTTSHRFTKDQLYSTASYAAKDLQRIGLDYDNLTGWDFSGQNLTGASMLQSTLTNANLTGADLRRVNWDGPGTAILKNTILPDGQLNGLNLNQGEELVVRNYHGNPDQGLGPIPVTIHSGLTIGNGGLLSLQLDGQPWESTIVVAKGTPVTLGGTLKLGFAGNSDAMHVSGQTLKIFGWSSPPAVGNKFADIKTDTGTVWDLSKLYTTGNVTLLGISSDLDADHDVDAKDLLGILANWTGSEYVANDKTWHNGDSDGDGDIDSADMLVFLSQWTGTAAQAARLASVPEPSAIAMVCCGSLAFIATRSRRRGIERRGRSENFGRSNVAMSTVAATTGVPFRRQTLSDGCFR